MAEVIVLGAGLGGTLMAYELHHQLRPEDRLTVIGQGHVYHFVPSNPWVAIGWRERKDVDVDLIKVMKKKHINYLEQGAKRVNPAQKTVTLNDGREISYDYLVIATGPDLAFDDIEGFGPAGHTQSICHIDHAESAHMAFQKFLEKPGPIVIGAVQGASCFGPAYEFAFILDTELRRRQIRDQVPITFVTSEPYIGHLGLDGVGDTKGLLESELRNRHIKWMTSARVKKFEDNKLTAEEVSENGEVVKTHEILFSYAMMLPAFRGVEAVRGIDGLVNSKGFVLIDEYQRNPTFSNVFAIGVCVAIPPIGPTPVPVGVPKTGFMIESMVTATARNIGQLLRGRPVNTLATWNAICLADFGDKGVAFVAQPQIPPRNLNWSSQGRWVHIAKLAFEKFFIYKIRRGTAEPFYERWGLQLLGVRKLKTLKETRSIT
ncbi:MAG: FAD-dependent oxidoreductase [Alphaproteobacteria bacterium]|nr:FAD-dependent oxidoreductase [Alphaproteobacteria bacterium]